VSKHEPIVSFVCLSLIVFSLLITISYVPFDFLISDNLLLLHFLWVCLMVFLSIFKSCLEIMWIIFCCFLIFTCSMDDDFDNWNDVEYG